MPQSSGATAGAALGLALIAIMSRVIAAFRTSLEYSWRLQSGHLVAESKEPLVSRLSSQSDMVSKSFDESQVELQQTSSVTPQGQAQALVAAYRLAPAFNPSRDLTRGLMHAFSAFVGYLLMLAVGTFVFLPFHLVT